MKLHPVHFLIVTAAIISCNKNDDPASPGPGGGKKWFVSTVAGNGIAQFEDGPALMAGFKAPQDVAVASDGSLYVADAINHRIRKIAGDFVTTYAGSGVEDTTGGIGGAAAFALPIQITADLAGNLYTL